MSRTAARRVLALIRQTRAGDLNDSEFGRRFSGTGDYAGLLGQRFARAVRQLGFLAREGLDCTHFRVPAHAGEQLSLL